MSDNATFRILDANFNRSREALRVMEEYARFVLDDAALTEALKGTRHELVEMMIAFEQRTPSASRGSEHDPPVSPPEKGGGFSSLAGCESESDPPVSPLGKGGGFPLIAHRDIEGDAGRDVTTSSEFQRANVGEVAVAAAKRLSEALRTIEEYGKTVDPTFAAAVEQLRYRGYELERRLFATIRARERFAHVRLYVIITESLSRGDWFETAEAALRGGADCLQLREKELSDRELLIRAKRLAELCRRHEALFIVNDRPDIALAAGAHGVHLGQNDLPVAAARRVLPPNSIVGLSTHTAEQVEVAVTAAPDYIAVGPMFDSPTKPQSIIAGPGLLARARECTSTPLVAIGGIDASNVGTVLDSAPSCICVCRAVIWEPDAGAVASRLRKMIDARFADSEASGTRNQS